jgi:enamine deaminase RidA (YjgF/YER057c/UK114 family)
VDAVWKEHFREPYPMGTCIQAAVLGKEGARMEIEIVLVLEWRRE